MRLIKIVFLVLCSLGVGLVQERVKVNINSNLDLASRVERYDLLSSEERKSKIESAVLDVGYDYYHSHQKIDFLYQFTIVQLKMLKWLLTGVLIVLHFSICYVLLKAVPVEEGWNLAKIYMLGVVIALVVFLAGKLMGVDLYLFSRRIIGFLQSILPAALLYLTAQVKTKV